MAFATETRSIAPSIFERISKFAKDWSAFNAQQRVYRETVRELSRLSNRDLADLGLNRSMIGDIAREAAFGK
jgi:uncharacterized protein YjiS (DUF1127 family)